jgi:hypothetical protein
MNATLPSPPLAGLLADAVLLAHLGIVVFNVGGLAAHRGRQPAGLAVGQSVVVSGRAPGRHRGGRGASLARHHLPA